MTDERKSSSWWQTAPGALTAVAAFLAAISGLLGGLNQIGVFDRLKRPATPPPVTGSAPRTDTTASGAVTSRRVVPAPTRRTPAQTRHTQVPPAAPAPSAGESGRARAPAQSTATPSTPDSAKGTAPPSQTATPPGESTNARPAPSSAPPAADTAKAPVPAPTPAAKSVPSGTALELAAQSRVCSTTSKPGDHFAASVVVPVTGTDGVLVPASSSTILEVTPQDPPAFLGARADSLVVNGKAHPITASSTGRIQREFVAGPGERGVGIGACIPAGGRITVTLTAPVSLGS